MVSGGVTTTYSYGSYNRLSKANTSSWTATYTFDSSRNLKSLTNGSTTYNYYYDYDNRLTSVVKGGSTIQKNTYDGNERRQRATGLGNIYYAYEESRIIWEKNFTGTNTVTDHFYANGLRVAKSVTQGSTTTTSYYQTDILGNTRLVTVSSGNPPSTIFSSL